MKKRSLSVLLVLCLLLSAFTLTAGANPDSDPQEEPFAPEGYQRASSFEELVALNADDSVEGIFIESEQPRDLIRLESDVTITKKLWVGECDLVLQPGMTLNIVGWESDLLFERDGRIVCESAGAAHPDALAGGTLQLDGTPVFSGDPAAAPVNPTGDIIWLCSHGTPEKGEYPAAPDVVMIGYGSAAELHGSLNSISEIMLETEGQDSFLRLVDDFECEEIVLRGNLDLCGHDLSTARICYCTGCRIFADNATITGSDTYELLVNLNGSAFRSISPVAPGEKIYLEGYDIDPSLFEDPSLLGWRVDPEWKLDPEMTADCRVEVESVEESGRLGEHYFVMLPSPTVLSTEWDSIRVELEAYDATVAFEGIRDHKYSMMYLDNIHSTAADMEPFGIEKEMFDAVVKQTAALITEDETMLSMFAFAVMDGEEELDPYDFELRFAMSDEMKAYPYINVRIVRIMGDRIELGWETVETRVEGDELIVNLPCSEDAYIITGSSSDPYAVSSVELTLERPASGLVTDTPHREGEGDWDWRGQSNRPDVRSEGLKGAYIEEAVWTLADDAAQPFIGQMTNGIEYGVYITVNAEPDFHFTEDAEIKVNVTTAMEVFTHVDDRTGRIDILYLVCRAKPIPTDVYLGDVDDDKEPTIIDATYIQRYLAGLDNLLFVEEVADVDDDKSISIVDATQIQRYLVGFEVPYPIGDPV